MTPACSTAITTANLARDVLASTDCMIAGGVERGYAALLAPGGSFATALTIALTIYVAIVGYRLVLGQGGLSLGEMVPHFVKIGVILALATSWPTYQTLVFDVLFKGPEQLANLIVGQAAGVGTGPGDVLAALQDVFDRLTDAAADAWAQVHAPVAATASVPPVAAPATPLVPGAPAAPPPVPITAQLPFALGAPQFVAALLWLAALVLMGASVGVLLVVRLVLALLLLLGPLFVACALFAASRGLFEGWLRTTVKFALVPLFTLPLTAAAIAVIVPFAAVLGQEPITNVRDSPALIIVFVVLVFAAVMVQAARLGGGIAGGIRLPRRTPAVPASAGAVVVNAAATETRVVPFASRAETIVQAIDAGGRRAIVMGGGAATPPAMLATRAIAGPAGRDAVAADTAGRLGQGYRRLAIGTTGMRR